jgi:hypothetical protein
MGEQMDHQIEDYSTSETDYLPHVIARCVDKANRHQKAYRFRLNGAVVVVAPGQTAASVNEEVQKQWQMGRTHPAAGVT